MARMVRDARLETREARRRLPAQKEPHWKAIHQGGHLGYYKGPRGGTWLARWRGDVGYRKATLGKADDARDADGTHVLSYRQAQAKAIEQFAAWERAATGSEEEATGPLTVADAVHDYLAWITKHRKPTTAREWRYMAEAHILTTLGGVEIRKLATAKIRQWHEEIAATPARLRTRLGMAQRHRDVATDPEAVRARRATANRNLTVLKAALNKAFHDGKVPTDQAWRRVKPFRGADAARVRYLQEDECRRLLNACPEDFRRLVRGALVSGCRYGELGRAEVRDFNRDGRALRVQEAKSNKPRWVPLDDGGVAFFDAITAGRSGADRMFLRADGKPWGKSHQMRPLLEACKAARIDPIGFHVLRHTWASHRVMRGMPLLAIAQVLGHSDTRMCERHYSHLAPSYVHDAVRRTSMNLGPHDADPVVPLRSTGS